MVTFQGLCAIIGLSTCTDMSSSCLGQFIAIEFTLNIFGVVVSEQITQRSSYHTSHVASLHRIDET
jgi:hypothetical protein